MKKSFFFFLFYIIINAKAHSQDRATVFYQSVNWSPDGKKICYTQIVKDSSSYRSDVYIVNTDGCNNIKIASSAAWPCWSPDGKHFAYEEEMDNKYKIVICDANGSGKRTITNLESGNARFPSFSPDSKKICFSLSNNERSDIYSANIKGTELQQLSFGDGFNLTPIWNPKSNQIVFYKEKKGSKDKIYYLNIKDKREILFSKDTLGHVYPSWDNSGRRIIYGVLVGKEKGIGYIDIKKGDSILSVMPPKTFFYRMSADGKMLAIITGGFPRSKIYLCKPDGSNLREVVIGS